MSPRTELRRSARLAAARATRDDIDNDDEERASVAVSISSSSSKRPVPEHFTRALRMQGCRDGVYQPDKQLSVKQLAGLPVLYGAAGAGRNRQVQPLTAWLQQYCRLPTGR